MYTGVIIRAGETSAIQKVNIARQNFGYEEEDIIAILKNGRPVQIETIGGIENLLGASFSTIDEALPSLLAYLESQAG